jgi:hypothetical protein
MASYTSQQLKDYAGLRGYYKGSSLVAPVNHGKEALFLKIVADRADKSILELMKEGVRLADIGRAALDGMNLLEQAMCDIQDDYPPGPQPMSRQFEMAAKMNQKAGGPQRTGEEVVLCWFASIYTLLKLKLIKNDEMNGWLLTSLKNGAPSTQNVNLGCAK